MQFTDALVISKARWQAADEQKETLYVILSAISQALSSAMNL